MSFRLADLKKSVRKGREGHVVTPARLEGRPAAFRVEFLLQQFEGHLGAPRRTLDPESLLDFMGDARLGRGLLATLAQWYRMRPRTFAELLEDGGARLRTHGIEGPIDLRAYLYSAVNRGGTGFLDPESAPLFWQSQGRVLGIRQERLPQLILIDRPEEAILVRTGPAPTAADVMAAYNARAHTTLLRSAAELTLHCDAPRGMLEGAVRAWADPLEVEWQVDGDVVCLFGRPDALGCWTRHGRRVERAALELLSRPDLQARELRGRLAIVERECRFSWKADTLAGLGAGSDAPGSDLDPDHVDALASTLRRERERGTEPSWSIRRATHLVGAEEGVFLPHLELRRGDLGIYLRVVEVGEGDALPSLAPFIGKTPVAYASVGSREEATATLQFPGEPPRQCPGGELLPVLAEHLDTLRDRLTRRPALRTAA